MDTNLKIFKELYLNLKKDLEKQIKYLKQDLSKNNKPDIAQKGELLIKIINGDEEQYYAKQSL